MQLPASRQHRLAAAAAVQSAQTSRHRAGRVQRLQEPHWLQLTSTLANHDVIDTSVPVVSELRLPGKVTHVHHSVSHKEVDDISGVDIQDDERVDLAAEVR